MNIFKFVNSKAIKEHLQAIDYHFSSAETAWLVYRSKFTTLNEKIRAYNYIIEQMPDAPLPERVPQKPYGSLHVFLKNHIALIEQALNWARSDNDGVYTYSIDRSGYCEDPNPQIYPDHSSCHAACKSDIKPCRWTYSIKKQSFDSPNKIVTLHYNEDHVITDIDTLGFNDDYFSDILSYYCFNFPTAFQKGDILYAVNELSCGPFVMMDCSNDGEMDAWGYFMDDKNGMIHSDLIHNYMDLDYYPELVKGKKRFLKALSYYLKNEIDIDLLLNAYLNIILGEYLHSFRPMDQTKKTLEELGFLSGSINVKDSMQRNKVCTMCGRDFNEWDHQENFCFNHHIGYDSKYDLNHLRLNLCIDCFDKVLDFILPQCKTNPLSEYHLSGEIVKKELGI